MRTQHGQLFMIGEMPNIVRIFYYGISHGLHIELIDRRNRDLKHLVQLVNPEGKAIQIPPGSYFKHVASGEEMNLLENRLRELSRTHDAKEAVARI